ncbi:MAG: MFS transporter [Candidatus Acidiferrales bacterium]
MSEIAATIPATSAHPLKIPYFRNLWVGATVSLLGDQFYFVALPWLALQITGSGLVLGTILMAAAIPRAAFMLMGGVLSDRTSPRRILLGTAGSRTVLVAAVAALVYWHAVRLWHLYVLGAAFGFADAFAFPAMQALIPALVATDQLAVANALLSGSTQFSMIGGPAPAGLIIKRWGIAWAFVLDAFSFFFILAPLYWLPETKPSRAQGQARKSVAHELLEGIRYVLRDPALRAFLILMAALNLALAGPLLVGLATLAKERFSSPAAFGTLLSSLATGGLIGTLLPAILRYRKRRGITLLLVTTNLGIGMGVIGFLHHLLPMAIILFVVGLGNGFSNVNLITWFQARVERALLGRVMSVLMFCAFGLLPVSYAIAGAVAQMNLRAMFIGSGALAVAMAGVAAMNRVVREID